MGEWLRIHMEGLRYVNNAEEKDYDYDEDNYE
jgi:hypothetical protein